MGLICETVEVDAGFFGAQEVEVYFEYEAGYPATREEPGCPAYVMIEEVRWKGQVVEMTEAQLTKLESLLWDRV